MSILSACEDAVTQCGNWLLAMGWVVTHYINWFAAMGCVAIGFLASFEFTAMYILSLIGMHYELESSTRQAPVLYAVGVKDILTIIALHLPIHVLFCYIWDNATNVRPLPGETRESSNRFRFYCIFVIMLGICHWSLHIVMFKDGYWTAFPPEWKGPQGHLTFSAKLYFLMQTALFCYILETLYVSFGQTTAWTLMRDWWIDVMLSLVFSIICYALDFTPLMIEVFTQRLSLQGLALFMQAVSLMELSVEEEYFARLYFVGFRWLSGAHVLFYVKYLTESIMYFINGSNSILEMLLILVPLGAMLVISVLRVRDGRKFDLDILQSGGGAQAS